MAHKHARALAAALSALILAVAVVACGGDDDEGGGDGGGAAGEERNVNFTLQVGDLVPLTGDLSAFGPPGRKAADLAVQQLEDAFQAANVETQIEINHADTETNPQAAVQAARRLVSGGASCLTGAWASASTIPVGTSVAARQQVPTISPASTSAEISGLDDDGFVFRVAPSDNLQAVALADVIEEELGGTDGTVSVAARNDAYGQGFAEQFVNAWRERGGEVQGPVLYDPEQPSFNSEAAEIVSGNPEAFMIIDFPDTFAKMGAALVRTGNFDASKLFTADGLAADRIPENIPQTSLQGARGTRPGTPEQGQVVEQFNTLYTEAPGPNRQTFDAQNFDAVMLCALAAMQAGSNEGPAIKDALQDVSGPPGNKYTYLQLEEAVQALANGEDIDFEGVTGPIDFDENGDPTSATYEVWRYGGEEGRIEVLRQFQARGESPGGPEGEQQQQDGG